MGARVLGGADRARRDLWLSGGPPCLGGPSL